jgi:myosin-crossreactive antigen
MLLTAARALRRFMVAAFSRIVRGGRANCNHMQNLLDLWREFPVQSRALVNLPRG